MDQCFFGNSALEQTIIADDDEYEKTKLWWELKNDMRNDYINTLIIKQNSI